MAVMTTHQSEGVLLEEKMVKATILDKDIRNGDTEVNGHASPAEIAPAEDIIPNHKTDATIEHNEDAFSSNQAVSTAPNGVQKPATDAADSTMEDARQDNAADSEMPDAPVKSPTPPTKQEQTNGPTAADAPAATSPPQISAQQTPASPAGSAISPGTKEDVVMGESQPQVAAAETAESTQDTAISDVPAATPSGDANDAATSPTNAAGADVAAASPSAPITADTSLSEPSQTATKVSRERDIDSEDEPVAKRAKVDTTAEAVEVKTGPDRMEVDLATPAGGVSVYKEDGKPKDLADPSLNGNPITNYQSRMLRQVLAGVKKTKAGASFKAPVQDLWPALWSDYSARISNPIDIGTMEKKLRGDLPKYPTMADFKADITLLVENSIIFNGPDHEVTALARSLKEMILQRMAAQHAAEPVKEKKEPAKQHPTRHAEPRVTAPPAAAASPQRPPKTADAPPKPAAESSAYAIPANNNGVPLIRRDSTKGDGRAKRPVKPAHPKDLVYDNKRKKLSPELRFCEEVLQEIRKGKYYDCNNAFLQPVDPVALQIPTYHKIVRKPMDLSTMHQKLGAGDYASAKEFEKDFDLIVKNCRLFNGEDHLVYKQALALQQLFRKEFSKKDDWMAKHAPPPPPASFHAASPAPKDDSEDEAHESEAEPDNDPDLKAAQARVATIQRRLVAEQQKVNDMINAGTADIDDVEVAQSVVALLQKNLMAERAKLTQLQQSKPAKPKATKPKKAAGGGGKKAAGGGAQDRPTKKAGGTKKVAKRKIGTLEKEIIAAGIADLDGADLEKAIDIIKRDTGQGENDSGELELDIEQLSDAALIKLYDLATAVFPDLKKQKEELLAPAPVQAPAPKSKTAAKNKKNKPMSKSEQERRIQQLHELRAQAGRQGSGSQEPMESIEGNGNGRASADPVPNRAMDSDEEESSEEE
jgi:bromodomain-containing factor 1